QGDRPAFLAALRYLIGLQNADALALVEARNEASRVLGGDIAAGMLVCGVSAATKRGPSVALPPVQELSKAGRSAWPASLARVAALIRDVGIARFELPGSYLIEAEKQFAHSGNSLDSSQLRTLAETALAAGR